MNRSVQNDPALVLFIGCVCFLWLAQFNTNICVFKLGSACKCVNYVYFGQFSWTSVETVMFCVQTTMVHDEVTGCNSAFHASAAATEHDTSINDGAVSCMKMISLPMRTECCICHLGGQLTNKLDMYVCSIA